MGDIVTFYSFKGGAGRSMAVANVGFVLAQWGYRILLIDLDLEAPGLESFFSSFVAPEKVRRHRGVIDYLDSQMRSDAWPSRRPWADGVTSLRLPKTSGKLELWGAGRRDEDYFKRVRRLDFADFYAFRNGGVLLEDLRNELKAAYDFVLLDSRTGLTEIGGLSTIQMPDSIVLLATPTEQALRGGIDIVTRAAESRQKLPFERAIVHVLPIPSRLDVQSEFRLAQQWLDRFARECRELFETWLPRDVNPRSVLELLKLPHVSYFSYGETLPVVEHGTTDPAGLGYAYENLAAVVAHKTSNVDLLLSGRDQYIREAIRYQTTSATPPERARIFVSYHHGDREWLDRLRTHLAPLTRSRSLSVWDDSSLHPGEDWLERITDAISGAAVAVLLVSPDYLNSDFVVSEELPAVLKAAEERGLRVLWIPVRASLFEETQISRYQSITDPSRPLDSMSRSERDKVLVEAARRIAEAAGRAF